MATRNTLTVSQLGERFDLQIRQGSTLGPIRHELTDQNDVPMDLTGVVLRGQVRKQVLSSEKVADLVFTLAPDPTEGWYEFGLPADVTEAILAGANLNAPDSQYVWDSEMELPGGTVIPLFYGAFQLPGEVTR